MTTLLFLAIGLGAGVLAGVFGIGGGVVVVPALLVLARFPIATATGTSLAALLLPVGALGAYTYYRAGRVDVSAALWIAVGIFVGAWVGARFAQTLPPVALRRAFAVFLALLAARVWWEA